MQEKERQVYDLLEITNRQFNECNALYHAAAQRCGLSGAAQADAELCRCRHGEKGSGGALPGKRRTQRQARDPDGRGACPRRAHGGAGYRSRAAGHDPSGPCRGRAELPPDPAVSGMLTAGV